MVDKTMGFVSSIFNKNQNQTMSNQLILDDSAR